MHQIEKIELVILRFFADNDIRLPTTRLVRVGETVKHEKDDVNYNSVPTDLAQELASKISEVV